MSAAYRVLRFSPNPEEVEHINVALLIWDGRHHLVFDESFPKLTCVAPGFNRSTLVAYLRHFSQKLSDASPAEFEHAIGSSQFVLTGERELARGADWSELTPGLIHRFLERHSQTHRGEKGAEYIDTRLHKFLTERLHLPTKTMKKKAGPSRFLSPAVREQLGHNGFHVSRVLDGKRSLVLIDALVMRQATQAIQNRASRIAFAFYRINQIRDLIAKREGRSVTNAVVLFSNPNSPDPHEEFVINTLKREAEHVFAEGSPPADFMRSAHEAALESFG